jgi:hypothetical protein
MKDATKKECMDSICCIGLSEESIESAISMLKDGGHTVTTQRVGKLAGFITQFPDCKASIVENNNWKRPPKPRQLRHWKLIGGVTYRYQLWAAIYNQ